MFNDEKIKLIKSLPNASDLLIEWIQILMTVGRERHLISGGTNSYLIEGEKDIPSQIFFDLKMIKEDSGIITVNNFENYAMFDRECVVNPNKMKDLRRYVLERDTVTDVWFYQRGDDYPMEKMLREEGFYVMNLDSLFPAPRVVPDNSYKYKNKGNSTYKHDFYSKDNLDNYKKTKYTNNNNTNRTHTDTSTNTYLDDLI